MGPKICDILGLCKNNVFLEKIILTTLTMEGLLWVVPVATFEWWCCSARLTVQDGAETYRVEKAISFDSDLTVTILCMTVARFSQLPQNPALPYNPYAPLWCILCPVSFQGGRVASAERPNDLGGYVRSAYITFVILVDNGIHGWLPSEILHWTCAMGGQVSPISKVKWVQKRLSGATWHSVKKSRHKDRM